MPTRRRALLLCGQARAMVAAIARELAGTEVALLLQSAPADVAATQRLCRTLGRGAVDAQVVIGDLGGEAESRHLVAAAWAVARPIEAVVICPALSAAAGAPDPGLDAWHDGIGAGLRAPFFLAKHAGLRLRRAGHGRLAVAIEAPTRAAGPVAHVVRAGLLCMVDALANALAGDVAVTAVIGDARAAAKERRAHVARGVRFFVEADPCPSGTVLELGTRTRRG